MFVNTTCAKSCGKIKSSYENSNLRNHLFNVSEGSTDLPQKLCYISALLWGTQVCSYLIMLPSMFPITARLSILFYITFAI